MIMNAENRPKLFVSYAHADGKVTVEDFWNGLQAQLKGSNLSWERWADDQIRVGEDWDKTITQALKNRLQE